MSESRSPGASRYQRSTGGLVGAMVVTVLAVVALAGFRALTSHDDPTPVRAVDYSAMVRAGRADHKLRVLAPPRLPAGWKATSASYQTGSDPTWHLGVLTDGGAYIGVEEGLGGLSDLVEEHVGKSAQSGKDVIIDDTSWHSWHAPDGDYAVGRSLRSGGEVHESWLVVGSAPESAVRKYAASLQGGSVPGTG